MIACCWDDRNPRADETPHFPSGLMCKPTISVDDLTLIENGGILRQYLNGIHNCEALTIMQVRETLAVYVSCKPCGPECVDLLCFLSKGCWTVYHFKSGKSTRSFCVPRIARVRATGVTTREFSFCHEHMLLFHCAQTNVDWQDLRTILWYVFESKSLTLAANLNTSVMATLLSVGVPLANVLKLNCTLVRSTIMFSERLKQVCITTIASLNTVLPRNIVHFIATIVSLNYFSESKSTVRNAFCLHDKLKTPQLDDAITSLLELEGDFSDWLCKIYTNSTKKMERQLKRRKNIGEQGRAELCCSIAETYTPAFQKRANSIVDSAAKYYDECDFWHPVALSLEATKRQLWSTSVCIQPLRMGLPCSDVVGEPCTRDWILSRCRKWLERSLKKKKRLPNPGAMRVRQFTRANHYAAA